MKDQKPETPQPNVDFGFKSDEDFNVYLINRLLGTLQGINALISLMEQLLIAIDVAKADREQRDTLKVQHLKAESNRRSRYCQATVVIAVVIFGICLT